MADPTKNIGASVRTCRRRRRLAARAFDVVLTRYVLERLLYRLGRSSHADRFVLEGAMLLAGRSR